MKFATSLGLLAALSWPAMGADATHIGYEAIPGKKAVKPVRGVAFSSDGKWLVTGGADQDLRVWDLSTGLVKSHLGDGLRCLVLSPTSDDIAGCGAYDDIKLYRIDDKGTAKRQVTLSAVGGTHHESITALAWSRDGQRLYSANGPYNGALKQWTVQGRKEVKLKDAGSATYTDITVAPDDRAVIASGGDSTFRIVGLPFDKNKNEMRFQGNWGPTAALFLDGTFEKGYTFVAGGSNGYMSIETITAKYPPEKGTVNYHNSPPQHKHPVRRIVLSPAGNLFASSDDSGEVLLWTRTGQVLGHGSHSAEVSALSFSRDGKLLASAAEDGTVRVWEVQPFRLLITLLCFADGQSLAYDPDGHTVGNEQQIAMWRKDGAPVLALSDRTQPAIAFLPRPPVQGPATATQSDNKKKGDEKKVNPPVTAPNQAPAIVRETPPGPKEEPSKETPHTIDPALVAARAAAEEACKTGSPPNQVSVDAKWRGDPELAAIAKKCAADADAGLRAGQSWFAAAEKRYGCFAENVPPAVAKQALEQRGALNAAKARYGVVQFVDPEQDRWSTPAAARDSQLVSYQLGMLALCYLGPLPDAAQTLDAIQPAYLDSQDRARQAYARIALGRAIAAVNGSNLDEADKQLKSFQQRKDAIKSAAVLKEEESDIKQAGDLGVRIRGKRLYQAGLNSIQEGRLEDGEASLSEARRLLGPDQPESADVQRILDQLHRTQSLTSSIDSALAESQKALKSGDLERARAKAQEAITLAGPNSGLTGMARQLLAVVAARQRTERIKTEIRWGTSGVGVLFFLVMYAIPTGRALGYSAVGLRRQAAQVNLKLVAAKATNAPALLRLYALRSLPAVSERLADLFRAYLAQRPMDGKVAFAAGQWALEQGNEAEAAALLGRALELGVSDPGLFRALLRLPGGTVQPGADNLRKIAEQQPEQREAALVLARHYMAEGNVQPEALALYETVLNANPEDDAFRLETVRALLRAGSAKGALRHLEILVPRGEANPGVWAALVEAARAGETAGAIRLLGSPAVGDFDRLATGESLAELVPDSRAEVDALYGSSPAAADPAIAAIMRVHHLAGSGDTAGAVALAESSQWPGAEQDAKRLTEMARALRRLVKENSPALRLALARTEAARGNAAAAFAELELLRRLVRLGTEAHDETLRALSRMTLRETAAAFFRQARWVMDAAGDSAAPPPAADPQVIRRFADARIYITEEDVEAQDVLRVRDEMRRGAVFLVVPEKPRRNVYALLYATLVEFPDLSLVPLDRGTMKAALADAVSGDVLLQTLNLWLGRGDVFDEHNPISDSAAFFGRGPVIHQLLNKVLNRQNFGLYGLRKMGKTSLVFQLREGLPSNILLIYVDLQGIASKGSDELCCKIVDELRIQMEAKAPGRSANLRMPPFDGPMPLSDALSLMEAELSSALGWMGRNSRDARILLVLDEIERMIPHEGHAGFAGFQEFFRLIRGMYQQRRQVVSAVVGADPTLCRLGKWGGLDNPVFQYYDEIFLAPLDRGECDLMVQGLAAILGVDFLPESLGKLYEETAGHPFVTRQLCSRILHCFEQRPLQVTPEMVMAGVVEYLELHSEYLREIFEHYLSKDAQGLLEGIAESGAARLERAGLDKLMAETTETPEAGLRALQELELFHLLARRDGGFEMPMGILLRYLRCDWKKVEFSKAE